MQEQQAMTDSQEVLARQENTMSPHQEKLARNIVSTLIMTLVQRKARKSTEQYDLQLIIEWVYHKVLKEVDLEPLAALNMAAYNKFVKLMIEDLSDQYDSQKKLLDALISDKPSFDDVVSKHLTKNLKTFNLIMEMSPMKRFFTALSRALLRSTTPPLGLQTVH